MINWFTVVGERSALEERAFASLIDSLNSAIEIKGLDKDDIINIETRCDALHTTVSSITGVKTTTYQAGARVTFYEKESYKSLVDKTKELDDMLNDLGKTAIANGVYNEVLSKYGLKYHELGFFAKHFKKNKESE